MLSGSSLRKFSGVLIAVLVLGIAVGAKIPTSRCKCHKIKPPVSASDSASNPTTNSNPADSAPKKKGDCPFATLRGLAGSFSIIADAAISLQPPAETGGIFLVTHKKLFSEQKRRTAQPRAPPVIA